MFKQSLILIALVLACAQAGQDWQLSEVAFDNVSLQPSDLEGWDLEKVLNNNELTTCGDLSLVGGYGSAGAGATLQKTFSDFPSHYKAKVVVTVFFIDSWDNEFFTIKANGSEVLREQSHLSWHSTKICGVAGWGERVATVEVEFAHSFGDLIIEFGSTLNEGAANESWGVRDFQLYLQQCDDGCEVLTEEFQGDFTEDDVVGWVGSRAIEKVVQKCEDNTIVGGYGKFGTKFSWSKSWEDLPEHYKIVVSFRLWQIDSWDGNEAIWVEIDEKSSYSRLKKAGAGGGQYQCGSGSWKDEASDVTIEIPHTGKSLGIVIRDSLNEATTNESWGMSNFRIYTIACEGDCNIISQEMQEDSFNADDIVGWEKEGEVYNTASACTRTSLVGGYNVIAGGTIYKTFADLPEHTKIMISIEVWFIDTWDNENFTITVDQQPGITTTKGKGALSFKASNQCGNGGSDEAQLLWVELPHFNSEATIALISELNQAATDESWGFREVNIYVDNTNPGKEITDSFTDTDFTEFSDDWKVTDAINAADKLVTECAGVNILGGYNNFSGKTRVSRTFTDLPAHDFIVVYFKAYFIDSWDKEAFLVQLDGIKRKQLTKLSMTGLDSAKLCGAGNYEDNIYFVEARFEHTEATALIEIFTMLDQAATDESWGMRDFHFFTGETQLMMPDCPTLYTECNYQGESFNLCENVPDFSEVDWTQQVHSVWVPEGWTATLFEDTEFDGENHVFSEPAACLEDGPNYTLIRVHSNKLNIKKHQNLAQINHLKIKKQVVAKEQVVEHKVKAHLRKNKHAKAL